jgi:hypothetical protein
VTRPGNGAGRDWLVNFRGVWASALLPSRTKKRMIPPSSDHAPIDAAVPSRGISWSILICSSSRFSGLYRRLSMQCESQQELLELQMPNTMSQRAPRDTSARRLKRDAPKGRRTILG